MDQALNGLRAVWVNLYPGSAPKSWYNTYFIKDPPCGGATLALILPDKQGPAIMPWDGEEIEGRRRHALLHLNTLRAWTIPNTAGEIATATPAPDYLTRDRVVECLLKSWNSVSTHGLDKADLAITSRVLGLLGAEVPLKRPQKVRKATRSRGKPLEVARLKAVKSGTRRAELCELLEKPRSIHELMGSMSLSRSAVLSHLHCLHRDNGLGYLLEGDSVTLLHPEEWVVVKDGA